MRLRHAAVLSCLAVATVLTACADETTAPPMNRSGVKPSFDHTYDPAVGEIAVNNYVLDVDGAAMSGTFKGQTALFNGNMAYGTSATQVFHVNTANGISDFSGIGLPLEVKTDGSVAGTASYTSTLFTEHPTQTLGLKVPLGIYTVRETYAWSAAPDDDYIILKYTLTNSTDTTISGLYTGVLLDPDVVTAGTNISTFNPSLNAAVIQSSATSTAVGHAVALLNRTVGGYRAFTNGGQFPDPNTNQKWFDLISSPITTGATGPADVRQYVGALPITLQPGETQVLAFAFVGGDNMTDLSANVEAARAKSAGLMTPRPVHSVKVSIASTLSLFQAHLTFASSADAAKFDASQTVCGSAPIRSFAVTGNVVDATFDALQIDDELRTGDKMYCTGRMSDDSYFAGWDTPQINADLTPVTTLTHFAGINGTPQFSPDGSKIVFFSARDGGGLFIMDAVHGDSSIVQLTHGAGDVQPSWSPDGTTIIYNAQNCVATTCATQFIGGIFAVDVATHAVRRLTQNVIGSGTANRNDSDPRYSPDGTRIAYRRAVGGTSPAAHSGSHIWLMGADGDMAPNAPSVALAYAGSSDLYPEWSHDGTKIYFSSTGAARGELSWFKIFSIDVAVGEPSVTKISDNEEIGWTFGAMSPDGKTLAAISKAEIVLQDIQTDLHTVPLFDPRVVVVNQTPTLQNIAWSPAGDRFVFLGDGQIKITNPKHLVTPVERAANLVTSISSLIDDGLISAADGEQLQNKLGNVTSLVQSGSLNAAVNNVNAFINKINALVNSRRIGTVTADVLTTNANALIDQISNS